MAPNSRFPLYLFKKDEGLLDKRLYETVCRQKSPLSFVLFKKDAAAIVGALSFHEHLFTKCKKLV